MNVTTYDGFCSLPWYLDVGSFKVSSPDMKSFLNKLPDSEFALICHGREGEKHRLLPIATPFLAKYSSAVLSGLSDALPKPMVSGVSSALASRLVDQGEVVPDHLRKMSSGGTTPQRIWSWDPDWDEQWRVKQLGEKEARTKLSTGEIVHSIQIHGNPLLQESVDTSIDIRNQRDADKSRDWLSANWRKVSGYTRQQVSRGLLTSYEKLGIDPYESLYAKSHLSELTKMSKAHSQPRQMVAPLLGDRAAVLELIKASASLIPAGTDMIRTYYAILDDVESNDGAWTKKDAVRFATKISHLDEALEIQDKVLDPFQAFFREGISKLSEVSEVVHVQGATIIREQDLEKLQLANLNAVIPILGKEVVSSLKANPVTAFKGLKPPQKRWMTNYISEYIKGPYLETPANHRY
jgi:hypothetical protein